MFSKSKLYQDDISYIAQLDIDWDKLKGTSILITGATGLIGTVFVDALVYKNMNDKLDIKIYALSRNKKKIQNHFIDYHNCSNLVLLQADVTHPIEINQKLDFVLNLASNTHPGLYASEPISTIETIVLGTKNILDLAVHHRAKRVINASSVEIYGENRGDVERFKEDYCGYIDCNTLRAGYSEGKRLSEALCQAYGAERGLDVISARLGRVYGAPILVSDTKGTTQFIRKAVKGEDIVMKSEGDQVYSYVYVADVVTAFLSLLINGESGTAYNIASDEVKNFRETAELLAGINNKEVVFETPSENERKGYSVVKKALMDSSKMKKLGWRAKYDLESGLQRTVHILRSSHNAKTI